VRYLPIPISHLDQTPTPTLYIFSGLPGTGKSTMAVRLSQHTGATYLRIDTIEQGIRDLFDVTLQCEGYRLTHHTAGENLAIGNSVVADSCNPLNITREDWQFVAIRNSAAFIKRRDHLLKQVRT